MKIAFISDVHSNIEALKSVFVDVDNQGVDEVVCLGDIVGYGASPNEVIKLLIDRKVKCLAGDHDTNAVSLSNIKWFNVFAKEALVWTNKKLTDSNKEWLAKLPDELIFEDKNKAFCCHGSPRDKLYEYLFPSLPDEVFLEMLEKVKTNVLVVGHTHIPDLKRYELKLVLNPGSVGQPRNNDSRAQYAVLDLGNINFVTFRQVEYDIKSAADKILQAGLPDFLAERLYVGR